jgi:hypothetical protein
MYITCFLERIERHDIAEILLSLALNINKSIELLDMI